MTIQIMTSVLRPAAMQMSVQHQHGHAWPHSKFPCLSTPISRITARVNEPICFRVSADQRYSRLYAN